MADIPLLRFEPLLRQYLWGGRRLAQFGKRLVDAGPYAESWEVVDRGADQSIVAEGPLAGASLHEIVTRHGASLLGRHHPQRQFPLLMKFLDCQRTLSVQVHPNDEQAARRQPPDLGKTEAWVVLAAERGSRIYAGLKPGVGRTALERHLADGAIEACLHKFEPRVGDCLLIEAGTIHALGAGLVVAEIQQASDTTFRLFDWDRLDRDGRPRALHIEEALATIDYARGPVAPQQPQPTERPHVERLVTCDKFVLDRWRIENPERFADDERFHIVAVIDGALMVKSRGESPRLRRGETLLVPAARGEVELVPEGQAVLLDMYLP